MNPFENIQVPISNSMPKKKTLSTQNLRKLLLAPKIREPIGIRDRALLILMAIYGLEVWQIEHLDMGHIDTKHETIQLQDRGGKTNILFVDEKLMAFIVKWLRTRSLFKMDTQAVFISMHWVSGRGEPGKRLSRRGIRLIVDGYLREIEIKKLGFSCKNLSQLAMQSPIQILENVLSIPN
ncbi:MAG: tyrosine-type recombinase/integrase [Anaerolineae bacterium]|jgi:integrase/recombinase XerD|nr:tyrosine-type recombinase/integrase [Anaerolineae bacterium]